MQPATRGDGLRLQLSAVDSVTMRVAGAIPGVVVVAAAPHNLTGAGRLIASSGTLAWQAPGSTTAGAPQPCATDGTYLIEDGDDTSKWLRVQVYADYLPDSGEAQVFVGDSYSVDRAGVGIGDVAAADALAGIIDTLVCTLKNVSPVTVNNVKAWIDRNGTNSRGITISQDNVTYVNPSSETAPSALAWASIAPGASVNLWVQRTTSVSAFSEPTKLNLIEFAWDGL